MTPEEKLAPDGSVLYMYSKVALHRIRAFNPSAKIIIMLRHPVDLVYSWHSQLLWNLNESETNFADAWGLCSQRAKGLCLPKHCEEPFVVRYDEIGQLGKYLHSVYEVFPFDQVKLIFMEDMKADTAAVYADALDFLRLSPFELPSYSKVNTHTELRAPLLMRLAKMQLAGSAKKLVSYFKRLLGLKHVSFSMLLMSASSVETRRKPIDAKLAQELLAFFREDIERLSAITGRNLDHWLVKKW
jgi:hypothetical protein